MNLYDLSDILDSVQVGRMIEIKRWEIVSVIDAYSDQFMGWLIKCHFVRPDRDTGKREVGTGRYWYVEKSATKEQVCRSVFLAIRMLVEHELLEFTIKGERLFNLYESKTTQSATHVESNESSACRCPPTYVCDKCCEHKDIISGLL